MTGLELAREYYEEFGKPMLEWEFAPELDRIAVGLVGHGSECFGYDDDISTDHDFEPGFCIWLTEEDEKEFGFRLFRAYGRLPDTYRGVSLQKKSVLGSRFKGVHTVSEFYSFYTGTGDVPKTVQHWMSIPDFYLAEATNGEVFCDPLGRFSAIREALLNDRPEDVRLKKLASCVFHMAQSGQYNYKRCLGHGEPVAAAVLLSEFVRNTAEGVHLLSRRYAPYGKWLFRSLAELPLGMQVSDDLRALLLAPYDGTSNLPRIERICAWMASELRAAGLSTCDEEYLEPYAYGIAERIRDASLRNSPIML